jgi:broad specificity phosphatase PhoE
MIYGTGGSLPVRGTPMEPQAFSGSLDESPPLRADASGVADLPVVTRAGAIVLARHGRPDCDRTVKITWREYITWWAGYDRSGLAPGQVPPDELRREAEAADVLLTSTLPRAMETGRAVAGGRSLTSHEIFVEAPLPPPSLPGRLRPGAWGVLARISWWFGASGGQESRASAERRAEEAARSLIQQADQGQTVMVFAHGWFNRMMRPVLKAAGWSCTYDGGDDYWSHRRYERVTPPR